VVLHRVVQQRGAGYVGVGDPVLAQDPDGDAQQVIRVGFALPLVGRVQPTRQCQRVPGPAAVSGGEALDLHQQPRPQAGLAVHGGDRVQRHRGQQSPFGLAQIRVPAGYQPGSFLGH
jgi:hypothetical protein